MLSHPQFAGPWTVGVDRQKGGGRRGSRGLTIAIGASLATHLAIGLYLLTWSFKADPTLDKTPPDPPIVMQKIELSKPPRQAPQRQPPPHPFTGRSNRRRSHRP